MVRMRSPVQIWLSAPRRTTSIQDVVFLRFDIDKAQTGCYATSAWAVICARRKNASAFSALLVVISTQRTTRGGFILCHTQNGCYATSAWAVLCARRKNASAFSALLVVISTQRTTRGGFILCHTQNGCCATSAWLWPAFDSLKRKRLVRLAWPSSPRANLGRRFFCVIRKTVAAQPLRGCGLRSTHSSASVWFVSLGHHLHGANLLTCFFALHAKRLLRNLCVSCHLRTPPERPSAFRGFLVA